MTEGGGRITACPSCGAEGLRGIFSFPGMPVHTILSFRTPESAKAYPRGDIELAACDACGMVTNAAFDPALMHYSPECEESQGCSPTFAAFADKLVRDLIERHDLRGKRIIEIGCGKGEFLGRLCELGENTGIGFDPAYVPGRAPGGSRVEFVKDYFGEKYVDTQGDFICCRMTLEHIHDVGRFMGLVGKLAGNNEGATVFFQVPDFTRIADDLAFEDIYYEHCSYFTPRSLSELFRRSGFVVNDLQQTYEGQYLCIEACSGECGEGAVEEREPDTTGFAERTGAKIARWRDRVRDLASAGRRIVVWGSGSKGVAFLTYTDVAGDIDRIVDISPFRQGTFLAGTGHEIVAPERLVEIAPDRVIVMNRVYVDEIERDLERLGLTPDVLAL